MSGRGRPRVANKGKTCSVVLTSEQLRHLDDVAEASDKTRAEVVRWALRELWRAEFPDDHNPF